MATDMSHAGQCGYRRCRHPVPRTWNQGCERHCFLHRQSAELRPRAIRAVFEIGG